MASFHLIGNTDIVQYRGELQLPKDYYEATNQTTSEIISTLIHQVLYIQYIKINRLFNRAITILLVAIYLMPPFSLWRLLIHLQ